ncbi:MAG: ABC transporter permease [Chloroflexota bacterium]
MASATVNLKDEQVAVNYTRQRVMGIVFLTLAAVLWFVFAQGVEPDAITKFGLPASTQLGDNIDWELMSRSTLIPLALITAVLGGVQLARGFGQYTNLVLAIVVLLFIFGFLVWGASGKSLNLGGLLGAMIVRSVPITLAAMSGILSERAGIVNIAIEGMMLLGAMAGALVGSLTESLWIGLFGAVAAGALLAAAHGALSIRYRINQIVSGTVLLIFATGFTSFIDAKFLQEYQELNNPGTFKSWEIPVLSQIPVIGPILFNNNLFVYAMFLSVPLLHFMFYYTKWGLRVRSVGEHPKAADTLGINVIRTRWISVLCSGGMAGLAGAYFTLGSVPRFDEGLTAGRGFIGLAAMIFGNWNPIGSFGAGLLFGFSDALQTKLAILRLPIPSEFLLMLPYVATMVVLAGLVGKGQMPAADGEPYEKE